MRFTLPVLAFLLSATATALAAGPGVSLPLILVNATTGAQVPFIDGTNIDPSAGALWFIIAKSNSRTSSVKFRLDSDVPTCDNIAPFTSQPGLPRAGAHVLKVTPYSRDNGDGTAGAVATINFTIGPTVEPTPIPTPSPTPEPTATPSPSPEPTPTPTATPEPSPTPTPEPSPTPTPSPTPEPTPSPSPSLTPDPSPTPTPEPTATPTPEPTATPTPSPTPSPTASPSATPHVINAASLSAADVQSAVNQSIDGDVVSLLAGTATWTTKVAILGKAITLQGAGTGLTIIKDGVQSGPFLQITPKANNHSALTRVTGIEFQDGGRTATASGAMGAIQIRGANQSTDSQIRLDHNKFNGINGAHNFDTVTPVIDHNEIIFAPPFCHIYAKKWNGDPTNGGEKSWNDSAGWGGPNFLFFEDNVFTATTKFGYGICDAYYGARLTVRHNVLNDCSIQTHGTETGAGPTGHGVALIELYYNEFHGIHTLGGNTIALVRSGSILANHNTITGTWASGASINLATYRTYMTLALWGGADGQNKLDVNDANGGPDNEHPIPFYSGSIASASGLQVTAAGISPDWKANQWVGYTIVKTSGTIDPTLYFSIITASTANTLTYHGGFSANMSFAAGDDFVIRKVLRPIDMTGVHGGTLAGTGTDPHFTSGHNDQVLEPCYEWNNGNGGADDRINFANSNVPIVVPGLHYFNNTPKPNYTPYVYPHPLTLN